MKASNLDNKFNEGEDVMEYFDLSTEGCPSFKSKRVHVDFPSWNK